MANGLNQQKVLDYIKRSGTLIAEAEKRAAAFAEKQASVQSKIEPAVEALIANGRIPEELRAKAAQSCADHAKTLEILASVAAHRSDAELAHLGAPVKTASAKQMNAAFVGADPDDERESDRVLFERFGIR